MALRIQSNRIQSKSTGPITEIGVWGFKSINQLQSIALRPLTLLAGANSSGKSSMMQPLLLLKQTMEVSYDPGALLLNGPNVRFTSADQIFFRSHSKGGRSHEFGVRLGSSETDWMSVCFHRNPAHVLEVKNIHFKNNDRDIDLVPGMSQAEIAEALPGALDILRVFGGHGRKNMEVALARDRFFLKAVVRTKGSEATGDFYFGNGDPNTSSIQSFARNLIHLPGLRGNPARNYPVTAVGKSFPGSFENYTASVIAKWQTDRSKNKIAGLAEDLLSLGLTWKVSANPINDTQVELLVGRLPKPVQGGAKDLVSIADVGFGVSQTLPVLVAVHAAERGQTVYLEQPEIHLHPRAQVALALVFAKAVKRGVRLIIETHSSILLLGLQTLVARQQLLSGSDVALHWFQRKLEDGATFVTSAELDKSGAFGDWPEDFGHVLLDAENEYLNAAEARLDETSGH